MFFPSFTSTITPAFIPYAPSTHWRDSSSSSSLWYEHCTCSSVQDSGGTHSAGLEIQLNSRYISLFPEFRDPFEQHFPFLHLLFYPAACAGTGSACPCTEPHMHPGPLQINSQLRAEATSDNNLPIMSQAKWGGVWGQGRLMKRKSEKQPWHVYTHTHRNIYLSVHLCETYLNYLNKHLFIVPSNCTCVLIIIIAVCKQRRAYPDVSHSSAESSWMWERKTKQKTKVGTRMHNVIIKRETFSSSSHEPLQQRLSSGSAPQTERQRRHTPSAQLGDCSSDSSSALLMTQHKYHCTAPSAVVHQSCSGAASKPL